MTALLQGCEAPPMYWVSVPVKDKALGVQTIAEIPVLLPHEYMHHLVKKAGGLTSKFQVTDATGQHMAAAVEAWCSQFGIDKGAVIPIGLYGDGVPFKAKMRDSLEQFSWSFCVQPDAPRILYTAIPKSAVAGKVTWDALLGVFAWSMRCMFGGLWPSKRHDGTEFTKEDRWRAKMAGNPFEKVGALLQCRGDWAFFKQVFNFPGWQGKCICWRCNCSTDERDYMDSAKWRRDRVSGRMFLAKQRQSGVVPSAIWQSPGFLPEHCMIDWLHTVDQGVGQDALGQLFFEALHKLPSESQEARLQVLWGKIKEYYKDAAVSSELDGITMEMIKKSGRAAKLNSKAAEARGLYKFGLVLAEELARPGDEHGRTVVALFTHLVRCMELIQQEPLDVAAAASSSKKFCLLYVALEQEALLKGDATSWRVKPKLHLFAELMQVDLLQTCGAPRLYWTYIDEGWNAWVAQAGRRRGGKHIAGTVAWNVLQRFRASLPRLLRPCFTQD